MSEVQVKTSEQQNTNKVMKKEAEVSCWNCLSTEDVDKDSGPITLPKVREKHRKKLKLYSFLASELSKPKTLPFKQKISENYVIGKRINEKLANETEPENYMQTSDIQALHQNLTKISEPCTDQIDGNELEKNYTPAATTSTRTVLKDSTSAEYSTFTHAQSNESIPDNFENSSINVNQGTNLGQELLKSGDKPDEPKIHKQADKNEPNFMNKKSISGNESRDINENNQTIRSVETELVYKKVIENPPGSDVYDSFFKEKESEILSTIAPVKVDGSFVKISHNMSELDSRHDDEGKHPNPGVLIHDTISKTNTNYEPYAPDNSKIASIIKENKTLHSNENPLSNIGFGLLKSPSLLKKYTSEHLTKIDDKNTPRIKPLLFKQKASEGEHVDELKAGLPKKVVHRNLDSDWESKTKLTVPSVVSSIPNTVQSVQSKLNKHNVSLPDNTMKTLEISDENTVSLTQLFKESVAAQIGCTELSNTVNNSPNFPKKIFEATNVTSPIIEDDVKVLYKVQIKTSTPINKDTDVINVPFDNSVLAKNEKPLEEKEISDKGDTTSSNGSECVYADSSNVQDLVDDAGNTGTKLGKIEEILSNTKNTNELSEDRHLNTSLSSLNKRPILKTSSLTSGINDTGKKPPLKSIHWNTMSVPSRSFSFEDEVYMSDAVSPGHATLPRRSNSPLPHERDLDRDRFPLNRSGLQARSESMASVYSGAGEGMRGNVTIRGEVQFSLLYNYRLGALEVGVKRCRDLAPIDVKRNRSDPYVKVYLLPDKSKAGKRKTKVKKNTLNPVFEETLSFVQPLASLSSRTLWLSAWHADMFGRNDFLGEVTLPLADVVFDDPAPMWYKLHERTEFDEHQGTRGDLVVGLKYEPDGRGKGTLHVLVKEAKNLVATKPNGLADVFCKSYLLPERGRLAKQKTSVARRSLSPRWEHTFTYRGLAAHELAARALELSLWDRDRLASNDFMGAVRLSLGTGTYMGASVNWMDSMGKEVALWQAMLQSPTLWVEGSLPLRPQLNN